MKWQKLTPISMAVMTTMTAMVLTACGSSNGYDKKTSSPMDNSSVDNGNKAPHNVSLMEVSSITKGDINASWLPAKDDNTPNSQLIYELHAGDTADFTPTTKTKIYTGKNQISTKVLDKLTGGQQYFIKLVVIDKEGATTSSSAMPITVASKDPIVVPKTGKNGKPAQHVIEIPKNTNAKVSDNQIIFPPTINTPKDNDYIVSADPKQPYLRKVVSTKIDPKTKEKIVTTVPASINEVVEEAQINSSFKMTAIPKNDQEYHQAGLLQIGQNIDDDSQNNELEWQDSGYYYSAGTSSPITQDSQADNPLQVGVLKTYDETSTKGKYAQVFHPSGISMKPNDNGKFTISAATFENVAQDRHICKITLDNDYKNGNQNKYVQIVEQPLKITQQVQATGRVKAASQTYNIATSAKAASDKPYELTFKVYAVPIHKICCTHT